MIITKSNAGIGTLQIILSYCANGKMFVCFSEVDLVIEEIEIRDAIVAAAERGS